MIIHLFNFMSRSYSQHWKAALMFTLVLLLLLLFLSLAPHYSFFPEVDAGGDKGGFDGAAILT